MAIVRTPIIDDDGSGRTGTVIDNAWKIELYDQIDGVLTPWSTVWSSIPFNAANFTGASGGTWAVTAASIKGHTISYAGRVYLITLTMDGGGTNTVTGSPVFLKVTLPVASAVKAGGPFSYYGPVIGTGVCEIQGSDVLNLLRDTGGTAWVAGSYFLSLQIQIPVTL